MPKAPATRRSTRTVKDQFVPINDPQELVKAIRSFCRQNAKIVRNHPLYEDIFFQGQNIHTMSWEESIRYEAYLNGVATTVSLLPGLPESDFGGDPDSKDGLMIICIKCKTKCKAEYKKCIQKLKKKSGSITLPGGAILSVYVHLTNMILCHLRYMACLAKCGNC